MLGVPDALVAATAMAAVIVFCRALPFLFFRKGSVPPALAFLEQALPPIAMTVLAVASYTSLDWSAPPNGIPELVAGALVVGLHLVWRNALLSIAGGTGLYILLVRLIAG